MLGVMRAATQAANVCERRNVKELLGLFPTKICKPKTKKECLARTHIMPTWLHAPSRENERSDFKNWARESACLSLPWAWGRSGFEALQVEYPWLHRMTEKEKHLYLEIHNDILSKLKTSEVGNNFRNGAQSPPYLNTCKKIIKSINQI